MRLWINKLAGWLLVLGITVVFALSLSAQIPLSTGGQPVEVVKVRFPDYNPDGTLKSEMFGDRALIEGNVITISNLRVEMYEMGRLITTFWAETCRYDKAGGVLTSDSPVRVMRSGVVMTGEGMDWKKGIPAVMIRRNVRVVTVGGVEWFQQEKRK